MIEVKGLTKYYGEHAAIHDLNFAIDRGEVKGVRVTPQIYTSPAELDALVVALTKIAGRA